MKGLSRVYTNDHCTLGLSYMLVMVAGEEDGKREGE